MARAARAVNLQVALTAEQKEEQMKATLAKIRQFAKAESKARSDKDKLVKQLEKEMTAAGKKILEVFYDNETIVGRIYGGAPRNVVDVVALSGKVTHAQLLTVVAASAEAVKDAFGTNVLNTVLVEKAGDIKLRVEVQK
jgi:hypothetical protein